MRESHVKCRVVPPKAVLLPIGEEQFEPCATDECFLDYYGMGEDSYQNESATQSEQ
jgi:hypothetical protein